MAVSGYTDYASNYAQQWISGKPTGSTAWYTVKTMALSVTAVNADGTNFTEVSAGEYERQDLAETDWVENPAGAGADDSSVTISLSDDVIFPVASSAWGYIVCVVVLNQNTGQILFASELTTPIDIQPGHQLYFEGNAGWPLGSIKVYGSTTQP